MRRSVNAILFGAAISLVPAIAAAHISISSGPGFANTNNILRFSVGHGCDGLDTFKIKVDIPTGVTAVLPLTSGFGRVSVEKSATGDVTAVTWERPVQDTYSSDFVYHEIALRARVPDKPFTTIHFPTHQYCQSPDGGIVVSDWIGTDPNDISVEPAPALRVVPSRRSGWNKFTVPAAVADVSVFLADALIAWKGNAAYSANPSTTELIKTTAGVTALTSLAAGDEIWVKY